MAEKKPAPPKLSDERPYADWLRLVNWWTIQTDVPAEKRGLALASSLQGKALDAVLELDDSEINQVDGVQNIITKLDELYKKNSLTQKIEDIEKFENYVRPEHVSIKEYVAEFNKRVNKLKTHKITYTDDVTGFKLLKGANIPPNEEKLIKATIADISFDHVLKKLKDIYGDDKPSEAKFNLKVEPTFYTKQETPSDEERLDDSEFLEEADVNDTFFTTRRGRNFRPQYPSRSSQPQSSRQQGAASSNWRDTNLQSQSRSRGRNPITRNGTQTKCRICQSINHWEKDCPDKKVNDVSFMLNEIVLHTNNDIVLKTFVSETWCSAVLDSGATNTVCGQTWFDEFCSSLHPDEQTKIICSASSKPFRFGDGEIVRSSKMAQIPACIGDQTVMICTDIVDADIPLLLSKTAMKKARMCLNFDDDSLSAFDQHLPLEVTTNGLYSLPITKPKRLINDFCEDESRHPVVLKVVEEKSGKEIATKLHRCFAHPASDRLIRLVNGAGPNWSTNSNLKKQIKSVTENCKICKIFKKPPPRPIVGLPMATEFQEVVAMDLKQYKGRQILHLVDLCTRLSAATFIPNKNKETIVEALFRIWISVYGAPKKFMSDNGGEFANSEFISLCEQFGIVVKTTAAESPWSNGIVERNNQTLARSMDKVIEDTGCHSDLALLWSLNAKNALQNVAGFSPFQLVLGMNPRLPSTLTDELPAITCRNTSQLIRDNLNAIHSARTAFIASENDEKIRRALGANIRSSGEIKYVTGDKIFYKRDASNQWHGPATVIGQVDQQVFVKHGSFYIRVHPCRLQLEEGASRTITEFPSSQIPSIQSSTARPINNVPPCPPDYAESNREHVPNEQEEPLQMDNSEITQDAVNEPNPECIPSSPSSTTGNQGSVQSTSHPSENQNPSLNKIKSGVRIQYTEWEGYPDHEGTVVSRAGKASGANKHWWNTNNPDGSKKAVDFSKVFKWRMLPDNNTAEQDNTDETVIDPVLLITNKTKELNSKLVELRQWKDMGVYQEVDDKGQDCISLRWVLKDKLDNDGIKICKARLCVRGFEEEQDFRTDSPTCSREGIRIFLSATASRKWKIHSMDVKGAFLQGKELDRQVTIRPPKEAETSKLWLLQKCAYGLADAPRCWYLRIREELISLGAQPSKFDNGIFLFLEKDLYGIVILYVDDIMWSGDEQRFKPIINKLKEAFKISHENDDAFTYIGVHTIQNPDASITVNQSTYTDSISVIPLDPDRLKDPQKRLNDDEVKLLRSALGQLNWIANMTRPDISFTVSKVSAHIKDAAVSHVKEINKLIKHVKDTPSSVTFLTLDIASTRVVAFTDSSFNNLDDGGSQGGQIVFLKDKFNRSCPISWRSTRVRRVARSTLAAESLAFADGMDTASFVAKIAMEFQMIKPDSSTLAITDSRSLYDAANTSTQISDRRLRVEISAIRDAKDKGEIEILWTSKDNQLADVLTKKGASPSSILEAIGRGRLDLSC